MEQNHGDNLGARLNKILQDNETEKFLTDERIKAEEYKTNYESLKIEYMRLQQEYAGIMAEMTNVYEEIKLIRERDRSLLEKAKEDILCKLAEIERLKSQSIDSSQMKVNQLKIREEIEESFKKMMEKQETENESLKKEQNKLRVENAFLKSEFENDKKGHLDDMEDMKARYKRDVEGMKKEKEMQEMEERVDSLNDLKLLKKLQKDNFDLLSKNVLLMRDAKELRQRTSGAGACVCMNPGNQESLLQLNETEKQLLKGQVEALRGELREVTEARDEAAMRNLKASKQASADHFKLEELVQKLRREVAEAGVEMTRRVSAVENEREKWKSLYEDSRLEMDVLRDGMAKVEDRLVQREKDVVKEVVEAKKEVWALLHSVEEEKLKLESSYTTLKQEQEQEQEQKEMLQQRLSEVLNDFKLCKNKAEADVLTLKTRLSGHESLLEELEKEKKTSLFLKEKLTRVETQVGIVLEGKGRGNNNHLQEKLEALEGDLKRSKASVARVRLEVEEEWKDRMASQGTEQRRLLSRVTELQGLLTAANNKGANNTQAFKQRNAQLKRLVLRHKEKVHSLSCKLQAAQGSTPGGGHDTEALRRKLRGMEQRCEDFGRLLLQPQMYHKLISGMSFGAIEKAAYMPQAADGADMDWGSLKQKIEKIGVMQDTQLQELKLKAVPSIP